jgi:hypothetical protein
MGPPETDELVVKILRAAASISEKLGYRQT